MYDLRNLRAGDILVRRKWIADHMGIYLGNGEVLHNIPGKGEHRSSFDEFADEKKVKYQIPENNERSYILRNAINVLSSPESYNIFTNNCEHTVRKITEGKSYSEQLVVFGVMCVTITVLAIIAKSAKN